ncbi:filamentous hemagglutinin family outer membrane protein [Arcobacter nitrofigilis DSM 7299]|uniref:Filamentous hemagglutinin family outer membrane protein n=1 Tax=Arcobacter nitrofigilis (strain ATCC 33309 / DSM 7299 / CCUG 15893 / LMG 7604 / NCTC 12251 / CI) TaxID=572480 RepID=D5V0B7_ARCNC|nr:GLUG motif-containing protein [Arcobacter nitrofigilis]ADG93729.1 filamentous hemagglutinin family outer membrane protein [Arcobacter nitrofigilis DSM 7299]
MKSNHNYSNRFRILKGGKISLVVSALLGGVTLSFAAPSGGTVTSGSATISQSGNTTNINQSTQKASINWNKFNIASHETVNFNQPNVNSITLNRVIGNERSIIDGALNANGQVWILNSNGVLFGKNASINTAGLLATTKDISDTNFQNGNYTFTGDSTESIINQGTIKVKNNGYVIFASNEAKNSGTIEAIKGRVQLTSADEYTINLNGNSLIDLSVDKGTLDALVENSGTILADGGEVYLTTHAVDELLRGVVNNTGIIEANSLDGINGHVELYAHGGTANIAGTIKAKDGFVETSGEIFNFNGAKIEAGEWLIDPVDVTIDASLASAIETQLASGDVTIETETSSSTVDTSSHETSTDGDTTDGDIYVNSDITWSSQSKLTLNAADEIYVNATIENTNNTYGGVYFNAVNRNAAIKFDPTTGKVIINNINQLQWISQALNGRYELGSNIDASDTRTWNSGAGFKQIGNNYSTYNIDTIFTGIFDGKGYVIDGLYINRGGENYVGLFGYTYGTTISNVGLINIDIAGRYVVGGLVGYNDHSTITNSYATGNVSGDDTVGGLVGLNKYSSITNSYATGKVSGDNTVGGLVGKNSSSSQITNSYATGNVSGNTHGGGLVGFNEYSTIINSYWDIDTTGQTNGVGLGSSAGATGIYSSTNTKNAFDEATYVGFDFTNTWFMIEGETRPFLRSEYSTTITNDHQLQLMAMDLTADYVLANNIKYTGDMWSSKGFDSIGDSTTSFQGNFDGQGHVIDGLYINRDSESRIGLFGYANGVNISNIGLTNVDIKGGTRVGGLVGYANSFTVNNAYTTGSVIGINSRNGGLIGYAENGTINNSYTNTNVDGDYFIGGLVGNIVNGVVITNSYATGAVSGNKFVGGVVGDTFDSSITNSYWDIDTTGQTNGGSAGATGIYSSTNTKDAFDKATYAGFDIIEDSTISSSYKYPVLSAFNGGGSSVWKIYKAPPSVPVTPTQIAKTTTPDLSKIITPIINKTIFTNKDIDTLLKSGIDIQTILQQLNTNELALIPGIVMQVLNGGINLPYGSKQELNLENNNNDDNDKKKES